jgi:hypothetical protein
MSVRHTLGSKLVLAETALLHWREVVELDAWLAAVPQTQEATEALL